MFRVKNNKDHAGNKGIPAAVKALSRSVHGGVGSRGAGTQFRAFIFMAARVE